MELDDGDLVAGRHGGWKTFNEGGILSRRIMAS